MPVLFKMRNLVELDAIPAFYISHIAQIEVNGPVAHFLLGNERTIAGERVCTPQLELVRPLTAFARDAHLVRTVLADIVGTPLAMVGLH
jgi:hypothetical protein